MTTFQQLKGSLLVLAFSLVALSAQAQEPTNPPAAPIPPQIVAAKRVFVSNDDSDALFGVPNLIFNSFYADLKNSGRFELMLNPADADLIFTVHFINVSPEYPIHLVIADPRTGVPLWGITSHVKIWTRVPTGRKNFDEAMENLVVELNQLCTPGRKN